MLRLHLRELSLDTALVVNIELACNLGLIHPHYIFPHHFLLLRIYFLSAVLLGSPLCCSIFWQSQTRGEEPEFYHIGNVKIMAEVWHDLLG